MNTLRSVSVCLALLLLTLSVAPLAIAQPDSRHGAFSTSFDPARGIAITIPSLQIGGVISPQLASHHATEPGTGLPILTFTLAIPHDATLLHAEAIPSGADTVHAGPESSGSLPRQSRVVMYESGVLRGYRLLTVLYYPARPMGAFFELPKSVVVTVTWTSGGQAKEGVGGPGESGRVIEALEGIIDNYQQARQWRSMAGMQRRLAASGGWGMQSGSVVILVPGAGIASVAGADIASISRGQLSSPRIADLRLRTRSTPIDFTVVDNDGDGFLGPIDTILFPTTPKVSEEPAQYYDATTDTNAYILSVLGEGGRPVLRAADGTGGGAEVLGFDDILHIEKETIYYFGPSLPAPREDYYTVHVAERVENEGYYWARLVFPHQTVIDFACAPHYWNYGTTDLRIRLAGATDTSHFYQIAVNGISLGLHGFSGLGDTILRLSIPTQYLLNGTNQLTLVPRPPPDAPDPGGWTAKSEAFLDWIEIQGKLTPSSFGPAARVRIPTTGRNAITIAGFNIPPTDAVSGMTRAPMRNVRRGNLYRLSSRQLEPSLRALPSFVAEWREGRFESSVPGIMMVEIDQESNRAVREGRFLTFDDPDASNSAVEFVNTVQDGNVLIAGVSVGVGQADITPALRGALQGLGSIKLEPGVLFQCSWVFAVRKGTPSTAVERFARIDRNTSGVTLDAFIPDNIFGAVWQGEVALDGLAGEFFQVDGRTMPRLRFHQADSLLSPANAADLLIITHPAFRSQAEQLAEERRRNDTLRVRVVDVDHCYDEFNDGLKSPTAIHRFLHYADSNWAPPVPFYVILLGDATVDPSHRLANTVGSDYVPTYGNPTSDYFYTVAPGDSSMRFHQLIGRLPANTPEEAQWIVDKIVAYDHYRPAAWQSNFLFMAGGTTPVQVAIHRDEDVMLAQEYILTPLFLGDTAMVFRTGSDLSFPDVIDGPWARSEMERGALFASFSGHGASKVYDLDFGYPRQVDNADRLFVLGTFSCTTGSFADRDAPGRNEEWLVYPRTGAVAAIGGTGWSYVEVDAPFKQYLFGAITLDRRRVLGEVFTSSKYNGIFAGLEYGWWFTPSGMRARNSLGMYTLLGDPSMKLALRNTVELGCADITALSEAGTAPTPGDSIVVLGARLQNYGRLIEPGDSSVRVVATIIDRTGTEIHDTTDVPSFGRDIGLSFRLPLAAGAGEYRLRLSIDPERVLSDETYRADNDTTIVLRVRGNQPLPLEPIPYGWVDSYDSVVIRLLNPVVGGGARITLDTSSAFDPLSSLSSATTGLTNVDELTTTWTLAIPQSLRSAKRFWWRAISTAGDTSVSRLFPYMASFTVGSTGAEEYAVGGTRQLGEGLVAGLASDGGGLGPGYRDVPLEVMSIGQADFFGKRIAAVVGATDYFTISWDGLNVLVFPPGDDRPSAYGKFAFWAQILNGGDDIDRFLQMIDTVKPGERVVVAASGPSFFWGDSGAAVRARLRSIGAGDMVDSLVDRADSYVLIGGKDIPGDQIVEVRNNATIDSIPRVIHPAVAGTRLRVIAREGEYVSPPAGPSREWRKVLLDGSRLERTSVVVLGIRVDGRRDTVRMVPGAPVVDIATVESKTYPWLQVRVDFPADTTIRLRSVKIDFDPTPELAIVPSTAGFVPDSVLQGDPARFQASVVNLSRSGATTPQDIRLVHRAPVGDRTVDSAGIPAIPPLDSLSISLPVSTETLTRSALFRLDINPDGTPVEPYFTTNSIERELRLETDKAGPKVVVYANGTRLMPGDFVTPTTEFEVRIFDNSRLPLDSSSVIDRLFLDYERIDADSPGARWVELSDADHRASFFYRPVDPLSDGEHGIWAKVRDASGNIDSTEYITFNVESSLRLRNVVNWPNPFAKTTTFTFMLGGATQPSGGEIAIFTIAGRKIRTIPLSAADVAIGFNRIDWDGLDADGDRLANGVYFYRLRVTDGEGTVEALEKLAVVR